MLSLNLLSPEQKMASSLIWKYMIIKNTILIVLTLSVVVSMVLFGAKIVLMQELEAVNKSTEIVVITNQSTNTKISAFNAKLKKITEIQAEFVPWSKVLTKFNELTSAGITFNNIYFDNRDGKLSITGYARTRNDLLLLQEKMENNDLFSNTYIPLDNLLTKNDIQFTLTADLNISDELLYE